MDGPLLYTILLYKIENESNQLKKDVSYYHDGTKNGGLIVPIKENEDNLITNDRIPEILMFRKK